MELRGGKIQSRGRQFSDPGRGMDAGPQAASQQPMQQNQNITANSAGVMPKEGSGMGMNKSRGKWLAVILIVIVVLFGGFWFCWSKVMGNDEGSVKGSQFQAVFLTNGQVYFGHIKNVDSKYVSLSDIFYLQVQQQVQPASTNNSNNNSQVSLAKLGNELHGPEDQMFIARDQVLFWENLKGSGKVVQAINSYEQQK